jgi:predicted restriction endonuclease
MPDDKFAEFAAKFSNEQERLDVNNGLLLVATLDALFDRELVSFKDRGEVIISSLARPWSRQEAWPP